MGPIWGRQDPGGPHVCPMNFAIWAAASPFYHYSMNDYTGKTIHLHWQMPQIFGSTLRQDVTVSYRIDRAITITFAFRRGKGVRWAAMYNVVYIRLFRHIGVFRGINCFAFSKQILFGTSDKRIDVWIALLFIFGWAPNNLISSFTI